MRYLFQFTLTLLVYSNFIWGDELHINHMKLLEKGYERVDISFGKLDKNEFENDIQPYIHTLFWPIEFLRIPEMFMGNMHQFQNFTSPEYYHGGVDILAKEGQKVFSPVSGKISAGYYLYKDQYDGRTIKYFLHDTYFH